MTRSTSTPRSSPMRSPATSPLRRLHRRAASSRSASTASSTHEEVPALAGVGLDRLVAVILAATRIVGMECPGHNSVFSGLTYRRGSGCGGRARLRYRSYRPRSAVDAQDRHRRARRCSGMISALYRPPPVRQASYGEIKARVPGLHSAAETQSSSADRAGLARSRPKFSRLAAHRVWLTYHAGRDDAAALAAKSIPAADRRLRGTSRSRQASLRFRTLRAAASADPHLSLRVAADPGQAQSGLGSGRLSTAMRVLMRRTPSRP